MATVSTLLVNLKAGTAAFQKGMRGATNTLGRFGNMAKSVGAFAVKSFAMIGAAAIGAGIALSFPIKKSMQAIDSISKMSSELDISTEALSGLEHAAQITGASLPDIHKSLQTMTRRLGEAKQGLGEARHGLKTLGLTAEELDKLNTEDKFKLIADRISKLPTVTDKAQAAYAMFGRQGMNMLNTLNLGAEGIDAMRKEAEELGLVFNRFEGGKVEAANDSFTRLSNLIKGITQRLTIALAPYLEIISDKLISMGKKGVLSVDTISEKMKFLVKIFDIAVRAINGLKSAFNAVAGVFYKAISFIAQGFNKLLDTIAWALEKLGKDEWANKLRGSFASNFSGELAKEFDEMASDKFQKAGENFSDMIGKSSVKGIEEQLKKNRDKVKDAIAPKMLDTDFEPGTRGSKSSKASALTYSSALIDVKALAGSSTLDPQTKELKKDVQANERTAENTQKIAQGMSRLGLAV